MPTKELRVMERVAQYGPCTLDELTSLGEFTRSSVYRSLTKLEDCGWVRRSLDRRRYFLSSRIEGILERTVAITSDAETIIDVIKQDLLSAKYRLSLIQHVRGDAFEILDATCSQGGAFGTFLDVQDSISRILRTMAPIMRERGNGEGEGLTLVRLPALLSDIAPSDDFFIDGGSQTAIIAIHSKVDGLFLLLCDTKNPMLSDREGLANYCRSLCGSLAALNEVGVPEMYATEPRRRSRRNIVQLGT